MSGRINVEKYASGFHIPELVERASLVGTAKNYHPETVGSIPAFEYYDSSIEIDGKQYNAHIRVKNKNVGNKYYRHTISEITDIEIEPSAQISAEVELPVNAIDDSLKNTTAQTQRAQNIFRNKSCNRYFQKNGYFFISRMSVQRQQKRYRISYQNPVPFYDVYAGTTGP